MRVEVHKHYYTAYDPAVTELLKQILLILHKIDKQGVTMAESPEVTAFRESVASGLENISADLQRLLERNPGLSEEDKTALVDISERIGQVASIVPEDGTEASSRRS